MNKCECGYQSRTNYPFGKKWQYRTKKDKKGNTVRQAQTCAKGRITIITPHHPKCQRLNKTTPYHK